MCVCGRWPGNRGDERYLNRSGIHLLVSRHYQRQGQRRAEDLLCAHGDEPISVSGDGDALKSRPLTHSLPPANPTSKTRECGQTPDGSSSSRRSRFICKLTTAAAGPAVQSSIGVTRLFCETESPRCLIRVPGRGEAFSVQRTRPQSVQ